jgi:ABC-type multidrug transport system ATPase subunit
VEKILDIRNLSKYFGRIKAVDRLSLTVNKGNIFGLLGPNGSGKTTTLSLIMGLLKPREGDFSWFGGTVPQAEWNRRIGSLIEVPNFYPYLSLVENLKVVSLIKNVDFSDIERVLVLTGLYERRKSRFDTLSLGMKQRLGLAAALLGDPGVLVLDEPTNGLDPEGIREVRDIILKVGSEGKTIILASHILAEVEKVCTHVAVLKKGELLASGRVGELLRNDTILIVTSNDNEKLYEMLVRSGKFGDIKKEGNEIHITIAEGISQAEVNKFAFENGIVLNRIEILKKSLETEFLELVKKN